MFDPLFIYSLAISFKARSSDTSEESQKSGHICTRKPTKIQDNFRLSSQNSATTTHTFYIQNNCSMFTLCIACFHHLCFYTYTALIWVFFASFAHFSIFTIYCFMFVLPLSGSKQTFIFHLSFFGSLSPFSFKTIFYFFRFIVVVCTVFSFTWKIN